MKNKKIIDLTAYRATRRQGPSLPEVSTENSCFIHGDRTFNLTVYRRINCQNANSISIKVLYTFKGTVLERSRTLLPDSSASDISLAAHELATAIAANLEALGF